MVGNLDNGAIRRISKSVFSMYAFSPRKSSFLEYLTVFCQISYQQYLNPCESVFERAVAFFFAKPVSFLCSAVHWDTQAVPEKKSIKSIVAISTTKIRACMRWEFV